LILRNCKTRYNLKAKGHMGRGGMAPHAAATVVQINGYNTIPLW
jgi:hypothetical protein